MNNKQISDEWFEYAEADLQSAIYLLGMKPIPFEIICYHCQQSAEKYLKGYIALNGDKVLKIHDLTILLKSCIVFDSSFAALENDCIVLTDYGVQSRYPFTIDITEEDTKEAIESAKRIEEFILKAVKT